MHDDQIVPAIQWHEGMLLAPHHFQQQELRTQQTLTYYLRLLSPFYWGVNQFKLDQVLLSGGILRLLSCSAIFPDGLVVQYESTYHPLVEVDLTSYKTLLENESWTIYLGVPLQLEGVPLSNNEFSRFHSIADAAVPDENVADNKIYIPRLIPRLQLVLSQQAPPRLISFPLVKVAFRDETYITLPYLPPCFKVEMDSPLGQRCTLFAKRIREKASYLANKWQNQVGTVLLSETGQLLRPLVQIIPILEGALNQGALHPYALYQILCFVAGQLATIRLEQPPPLYPAYNHEDILGSMENFLTQMETTLEALEENYVTIPFEQEGRFFFIHMSLNYLKTDALLVGVRNSGNLSEAEIEEWMKHAIIASDSALESVKSRRITGVKRKILRGPELYHLLPPKEILIFRVEIEPEFISEEENLNIFNMGDDQEKRPVQVLLYLKHIEPSAVETFGRTPAARAPRDNGQ